MKFVRETSLVAEPGSEARFTDGVWQAEPLTRSRPDGLRGHRFVYKPGARSRWHTHDGEQALFVVAGRGLVARWGEEKGTEVGPGDWVHVDPGEKHWHGAAPDDVFIHLAVTASGGTNWAEEVTDDAYQASLREG